MMENERWEIHRNVICGKWKLFSGRQYSWITLNYSLTAPGGVICYEKSWRLINAVLLWRWMASKWLNSESVMVKVLLIYWLISVLCGIRQWWKPAFSFAVRAKLLPSNEPLHMNTLTVYNVWGYLSMSPQRPQQHPCHAINWSNYT